MKHLFYQIKDKETEWNREWTPSLLPKLLAYSLTISTLGVWPCISFVIPAGKDYNYPCHSGTVSLFKGCISTTYVEGKHNLSIIFHCPSLIQVKRMVYFVNQKMHNQSFAQTLFLNIQIICIPRQYLFEVPYSILGIAQWRIQTICSKEWFLALPIAQGQASWSVAT